MINEAGDIVVGEEDEYYDVLHAPYLQGFSEGLQKKLTKLMLDMYPKKEEEYMTFYAI